jgi:hypothetical protein
VLAAFFIRGHGRYVVERCAPVLFPLACSTGRFAGASGLVLAGFVLLLVLPYSRGSSLQGAPVHTRSFHKIPSKHCRSDTRGRPPFGLGFAAGKLAWTSPHCLSVSFRQAMPASLASPF